MPQRRDVLGAVGAGAVLLPGLAAAGGQSANDSDGDDSDGGGGGAPSGGVPARQHLALLTGQREVPPVQTGATGTASFAIDPRGTVHYSIVVSGIQNVTMAHIHRGAPGENGPVVQWLHPGSEPGQEPQRIAGRFDGVLHHGTFSANDFVGPLQGQDLGALVEAVRANQAYVNVHTTQHPDGEIRGQIRPFATYVDEDVPAVDPGPDGGQPDNRDDDVDDDVDDDTDDDVDDDDGDDTGGPAGGAPGNGSGGPGY